MEKEEEIERGGMSEEIVGPDAFLFRRDATAVILGRSSRGSRPQRDIIVIIIATVTVLVVVVVDVLVVVEDFAVGVVVVFLVAVVVGDSSTAKQTIREKLILTPSSSAASVASGFPRIPLLGQHHTPTE